MVISMITGAIGAAFPAMKWFGEGLIDVGSGILTRGMYALLNPDMSTEEKLAYVFDLKQMGVDFITGVAMHFAFKGVDCQHFCRQIFLGYFSDIVQAFDTLRKNVCGDDYTSLHNPIVLSSVLPAYGMFHSIQILFL